MVIDIWRFNTASDVDLMPNSLPLKQGGNRVKDTNCDEKNLNEDRW